MRFSIACLSLSLLAACGAKTPARATGVHSCTAAGCESFVSIALIDAPDQATHYQVRVTYGDKADEVAFQCSFDMPDVHSSRDPDDDGGAPNPYDDPNPDLHGCKQVSGKKTSIDFSLGASAAAGTTATLFIRDAPDSMRIRVIRGAETIHTETLQPKYTELDPNGPDCAPHCQQAPQHDIDLR